MKEFEPQGGIPAPSHLDPPILLTANRFVYIVHLNGSGVTLLVGLPPNRSSFG